MDYGTRRLNALILILILIPIPTSAGPILIVSSFLSLGVPSGLLLIDFPITLKSFLLAYILATWPAHLNYLDLFINC